MLLPVTERRDTHSFFEGLDEMCITAKAYCSGDVIDGCFSGREKLFGVGNPFFNDTFYYRGADIFPVIVGQSIFADV